MTSQIIGRYEVIERLAGGAGAELFTVRVQGRPDGAVYCLKRVPPSIGGSVNFALRFDEEMGQWERKLEHRNIVAVRDHGEDGGHFFVMEFIDGVDLDGALLDGPLHPDLVIYIGIELCRAFIFIHHGDPSRGRNKPVIHADVSVDNVLLGTDGGVKMSDFGLAKALGRTGANTLTRTRGKERWLAPEQLQQNPEGQVVLNAKTDLFALGLLLWRSLVGTHPYAAGRAQQRPRPPLDQWVGRQTVANVRPRVAEAAPHAPAVLQDVIERLLQPMQMRTALAEEVLERLLAIERLEAADQLAEHVSRCAAARRAERRL